MKRLFSSAVGLSLRRPLLATQLFSTSLPGRFPLVSAAAVTHPQLRYASTTGVKSPTEIVRECDAVLSVSPKDVSALVAKCDALYRLGKWDEAVAVATEALTLDPVNVQAHVLKADCLHRLKKEDLALEAAVVACEKVPTSPEVFRLRGILLATKGNLSEALVQLNTAARLGPKSSETHYERGRVLAQLNDHNAAIAAFSKSLSFDPSNVNALNMKAVSQVSLKEFDSGLATWDQAVMVDPKNSSIWANKGKLLLRLKKYKEAIEALQKAIEAEVASKDPVDLTLRQILAEAQMSAEHWSQAATTLSEVVKADPDRAVAWALLGQCLFHVGRLSEGLEALDKAVSLSPSPQPAWVHTRANVLHRLGKDQQAIQELEKIIEELPQTNIIANLHLLLGQIYLRGLNDPTKAKAALDKAIEKDPEMFEAHTAKAVLLDEAGDHSAAILLWDKAVELNPDCSGTQTNRGRCLFHLKRVDDALRAFDRAISLKPTEAEPYKAKGVLLWTTQDQAGALSSWSEGVAKAEPDVYLNYLLAVGLRSKGDTRQALQAINKAREIGQQQGAVPLEVMELRDQLITELSG